MTFYNYIFFFFLLLFSSIGMQAQSASELEARLKKASSSTERMQLKYELAGVYMNSDLQKAAMHIQDAQDIARQKKDRSMAAKIIFRDAEIHIKRRDRDRAEARFKGALSAAKDSRNDEIALKSLDQLARIAYEDRNYRGAYNYSKEAVAYLKKNRAASTSSSSSSSSSGSVTRLTNDNVKLKNENRQLEKEIMRVKEELAGMKGEKFDASAAKKELDAQKRKLERERASIEEELKQREAEIANISEEKEKAEERTQRYISRYKKLSEDEKEQAYELELKEKELLQAQLATQEQEQYTKLAAIGAGVLGLLILFFITMLISNRRSKKALENKNKEIDEERKRSDELLLNILPEPIAYELKENGKAKAQKYDSVSVLFTDFKNFSGISEKLQPEQLVSELDHCFKAFDYIISQYKGIEKIKTIGDAYMCASGLTDRKKLPTDLVKAAMEMQEFLKDYKQDRSRQGLPFFEARIGIHTGPVVAGVVGFNKFAYDIWGDTVNIAARMESNSDVGRVNISESTYNQVKYKFQCQYRGKIAAKNKGMIDMYYVLN